MKIEIIRLRVNNMFGGTESKLLIYIKENSEFRSRMIESYIDMPYDTYCFGPDTEIHGKNDNYKFDSSGQPRYIIKLDIPYTILRELFRFPHGFLSKAIDPSSRSRSFLSPKSVSVLSDSEYNQEAALITTGKFKYHGQILSAEMMERSEIEANKDIINRIEEFIKDFATLPF